MIADILLYVRTVPTDDVYINYIVEYTKMDKNNEKIFPKFVLASVLSGGLTIVSIFMIIKLKFGG